MVNFETLIQNLGGAAKLADFTGEKPGTVQQRKSRNMFPPETWPDLIRWAHSRGRPDVDEAFLVQVAKVSKAENDERARARRAARAQDGQQAAA
jgi:hypothetical protein